MCKTNGPVDFGRTPLYFMHKKWAGDKLLLVILSCVFVVLRSAPVKWMCVDSSITAVYRYKVSVITRWVRKCEVKYFDNLNYWNQNVGS